ncbi:hypothetical protein AAVH_06032 [Aphelenchoides avenae]|nr:hypothetical protein AAVH_06032 [Aphelenchus avenae]
MSSTNGSPQHIRSVSTTKATHTSSEEHYDPTTPFADDRTTTISGPHNKTDDQGSCRDPRRVVECVAEFMTWPDPKKVYRDIGAVLDKLRKQNASDCRHFWEMAHCIRDYLPCIEEMGLGANASKANEDDPDAFFVGFATCAQLKEEDIAPLGECRKPLYDETTQKAHCVASVPVCKGDPDCPQPKWCE